MLPIFLGFLSWGLLLYLVKKYCKSCKVPYKIRGGGGGETTVTSHTYYYYKIKFPHNSIDPSKEIIFYNAFGAILQTIPAYYQYMNYGEGILSVPGVEQNTQIESVSTATYYVFYSTDDLVIDYENLEFKIAKRLIRSPAESTIKATYQYITVMTALKDVASVIDGRWDTQVQTEFFAEPPQGYNYAVLDLGAEYHIQALDIVAGFFKPDDVRKFDIEMKLTIKYSLDGVYYYDISDETHSFSLTGGESKSFEEQDLGVDFSARYLKLVLENVKKIDYKNGEWIVALTEVSAYDDIVIKSEATLIPTTYLYNAINLEGLSSGTYPSTITVDSTAGFELESGETRKTAYIDNGDETFDSFTYTGTTPTTFTGVYGLSASHLIDDMVVQSIESDTSIYDYDLLLPQLGDRLYKVNKIDDNSLFSQSQLDYVAKRYLMEFYKNHSKIDVNVLYAPHLQVGQTIKVVDTYNNVNTRYFIDAIRDNNGMYTITLARYPSS